VVAESFTSSFCFTGIEIYPDSPIADFPCPVWNKPIATNRANNDLFSVSLNSESIRFPRNRMSETLSPFSIFPTESAHHIANNAFRLWFLVEKGYQFSFWSVEFEFITKTVRNVFVANTQPKKVFQIQARCTCSGIASGISYGPCRTSSVSS